MKESYDKIEELPSEKKEAIIIHKRLLTNENETLCKSAGAKIYLSSRVTCPDCQKIMEHGSILNKSEIKRFIEARKINPEDFGLLEELAKFDKNLFIETLHNMFAYEGRNSRQTLETMIENDRGKNEGRKKLCELALKFFEKYGWAASVNMVGVLEDRKS